MVGVALLDSCVLLTCASFRCSDPFVLFSGGMPRASHGDRHTVTVMRGSEHVVFDLTSKIIDFIFISSSSHGGEGNCNATTKWFAICFSNIFDRSKFRLLLQMMLTVHCQDIGDFEVFLHVSCSCGQDMIAV